MRPLPRPGRSTAGLLALLGVLGLVPLLLLAYFAVSLATDAVRREVEDRMRATAGISAEVVHQEILGLTDVVESYAARPHLLAAIEDAESEPMDTPAIRRHLRELSRARPGIAIAFFTDPSGRLVDVVPATPAIVGRSYSFRDWYQGLSATGRTYVSEAYVTQAASRERVVAAATFVREPATGRTLGILVAAYGLDHLQRFSDELGNAQRVKLKVTDQRGVLVASSGGLPRGLASRRSDPRVAAALRGRSGVIELDTPDGRRLSAYAPVPEIGWTVTASVPADTAFAAVSKLRSTVLAIAGVLTLLLLGGLGLFGRTLWQRSRAERRARESQAETEEARRLLAEQNEELEAATTELENQNVELELRTTELEQNHAALEAANAELEAQRSELERVLADLAEEKERVEAFYRFGERIVGTVETAALARAVLDALGDVAAAEVGTLYLVDESRDAAQPALVAARGLHREDLPATLAARDGLAARAFAERARFSAAYGETGLEIRAFGRQVAVHREVHLPLQVGERSIGVVTLARLADTPFADDECEALAHLVQQASVALSNALAFETAVRLAAVNRALLDATPAALLLVDADGRPLVRNAALDRLTADEGADGNGGIFDSVEESSMRTTDPAGYRSFIRSLVDDPDLETVREFVSARSGRAFELYTAPVRESDGGRLMGRVVAIRETTAEREAERLKSDLVATVSHELRTPLTGILGFAELLVRQDFDDDTRRRYLEIIHREAKRLTQLVNDFLDLQRIEEGNLTLALDPFELESVVEEQARLFSAQSPAHTVDVELPDGPLVVLGDRDRISQVVANLVSNAIKYSPAGGRVVLSAEAHDASARVAVADEGVGIPADQQRRIFEKFFRVDSSDTREIGGTGLGLALAREIVEAHGGRIGFESSEGEGSTFWFELPLAAADREAGRVNGRPRALVIEDEPAAASLVTECLEREGFAIERAATGERGLELAFADVPAVVCLDLGLPGDMDGWDVLARLKNDRRTAAVPVVVCTADRERGRARTLGAADFLAKPFSPQQLRETVRRVVPDPAGTVLVVDDEPAVRRLVTETLRRDGLAMAEAEDGEQALSAVAANRPGAIVLDLAMPNVDGFAVLERLQEDPGTRSIPVIVLTARALSPEERGLLTRRAFSVLEKSAYSPDELRRLIHSALGS